MGIQGFIWTKRSEGAVFKVCHFWVVSLVSSLEVQLSGKYSAHV